MNNSPNHRKRSFAGFAALALCALAASALSGCSAENPDGPPQVRLDDSVCVECNMIISDARFATATVVHDERGRRLALLFDDFNCMVNHAEGSGKELPIIERWVRDHGTTDWVRAEDAHFVHAQRLRTPMASHAVAFERNEDALRTAQEFEGEVMDFARLRRAMLGLPCCNHDTCQ